MSSLAGTILFAFTVLMVKHTLADFFLQTPYQYLNKGTYGHPGGLIHAGIHVLLTLPVFAILLPASITLALAILAGEFVVHYHIDWFKERAGRSKGWTPQDAWFWRTLGLDQLAHMLTYIGIVALLLRTA